MKAGDIVLVRGKGWFANRILAVASELDGELAAVSHAGIFICEKHVIEALFSRGVVTSLYPHDFSGVDYAIASPKNITEYEREILALTALTFSSKTYGYLKIVGQLLDYLTKSRWFTRGNITGDPICSYVVAESYRTIGKDFDVDAASATPDDIWDFVTTNPDKYEVVCATPEMEKWLPKSE